MVRLFVKHFVDNMDETLVQACVLCNEIISNSQDAVFPEGYQVPRGFAEGDIFISRGNPDIYTKRLPKNSSFENCS